MAGSYAFTVMIAMWTSVATTESFQLQAHNSPRIVAFHNSRIFNIYSQRRQNSVVCNLVEATADVHSLSSASLFLSNVADFAVSNLDIELQSLTSGALCGLGDIFAQTKEKTNKKVEDDSSPSPRLFSLPSSSSFLTRLNLERTAKSFLKGLGGGLIWHQWYAMADVMSEDLVSSVLNIGAENVMMHTSATTISSILLEQFIACPIIFALWDLPLPALLNGDEMHTIPNKVKSQIGELLWENSKVWTFVNIILYNIPLEWRVFAMNTADLYWQSIYSSIAMKNSKPSSIAPIEVNESRS